MKLVLLAAVVSVCMLMSSAYPSQRQRQRQDVSERLAMMSSLFDVLQQSFEEVEAEGKKKKGYQIGTAVVGSGANGSKSKCPSGDRGKSATGQANGCNHADCTAAKNAAKATLRGQVHKECHKYIEATSPCRKVGC